MRIGEISARRELLARKNIGRRQRPAYLKNLSDALGRELNDENVLSSEQTDKLYAHFSEAYQLALEDNSSVYRQIWLGTEKDRLKRKLQCYESRVPGEEVVLFSRGFENCGAIKVDLHSVLEHIFRLLLVDGDSVILSGAANMKGLILDPFEEFIEGTNTPVYELIIWGDHWVYLANEDREN